MTYRHVVRRGAHSKQDAIAAIADALSFPDWFGHNLDALYDCLTDLSWLPAGEHVLEWEGGNTDVESVLADATTHTTNTGDRVLTVVYTGRS